MSSPRRVPQKRVFSSFVGFVWWWQVLERVGPLSVCPPCVRRGRWQVLERVGLPATVLTSADNASPLLAWGERDLHRLVATFLVARFPILLALNKARVCLPVVPGMAGRWA